LSIISYLISYLIYYLLCSVFLEELFMDYGSDYNRYNYASDGTDEDADEEEEVNPTQLRKKSIQEPDVFETILSKAVEENKSATRPSVKAEPAVPRITTSSTSMFDELIGNSISANRGAYKCLQASYQQLRRE
jgi:hypothetical protein